MLALESQPHWKCRLSLRTRTQLSQLQTTGLIFSRWKECGHILRMTVIHPSAHPAPRRPHHIGTNPSEYSSVLQFSGKCVESNAAAASSVVRNISHFAISYGKQIPELHPKEAEDIYRWALTRVSECEEDGRLWNISLRKDSDSIRPNVMNATTENEPTVLR
jgi:hypothetical protein